MSTGYGGRRKPRSQSALEPALGVLSRHVWDAIRSAYLDRTELRIVNRFYLDEMSVDEIAITEHLPEGEVCRILTQALRKVHDTGMLDTRRDRRETEEWRRGLL